MKIKFLPLLAGAMALTLSVGLLPVQAQDLNNPQLEEKKQQVFSELGLTEEQQAQIAEMRSQTRSQIENILTDEQKAEVQAALQDGQNPRQSMRSINLTQEQRDQIRSIMQNSRETMGDILTDEQKQQLREMMRSRGGLGQGRGNRN